MNMNDTIDLSGISADNIYRIRRSKKNGKLISHNEYGKVIIIKKLEEPSCRIWQSGFL